MAKWLSDMVLESSTVCLEPMEASHADALVAAASDGALWELWFTSVPSPETIKKYMEQALAAKEDGTAMPFVVMDKASGKVIGSTRYCNLAPHHRRLEIGYTWYSKSFQRTSVNSECKLLLLGHAFEALDAIAVEFRTHSENKASRAAIARLGARQDGILRQHMILPDGSIRDTVVFSIIREEWGHVKANLLQKMKKHREI